MGLFCFELRKKTERADDGRGEEGGQVPCRIAVTAKTELRRLKTRGVLPSLVLSLFARSRADRHGVSWLFSNFL